MTEWVALLRGVNVGGITIRSVDLRPLFANLGFRDVRTVLASGNVVFSSDDAEAERPRLKHRVEVALRERFDYEAWIVLVTREELARAIDGFPFDADDPARQPWVIFCVDQATTRELKDAAGTLGAQIDSQVDPVAAGTGVVYWNPVKGTTVSTPFAKLLAKPAYKARSTTRNLRTLVKILG